MNQLRLRKAGSHTSTCIIWSAYAEGATGVANYIRLPVLSHTAGAHSYQWVTSLQGKLCIHREVRAYHWCKWLALAQREHFNCSLCHAEIIRKVWCQKRLPAINGVVLQVPWAISQIFLQPQSFTFTQSKEMRGPLHLHCVLCFSNTLMQFSVWNCCQWRCGCTDNFEQIKAPVDGCFSHEYDNV